MRIDTHFPDQKGKRIVRLCVTHFPGWQYIVRFLKWVAVKCLTRSRTATITFFLLAAKQESRIVHLPYKAIRSRFKTFYALPYQVHANSFKIDSGAFWYVLRAFCEDLSAIPGSECLRYLFFNSFSFCFWRKSRFSSSIRKKRVLPNKR